MNKFLGLASGVLIGGAALAYGLATFGVIGSDKKVKRINAPMDIWMKERPYGCVVTYEDGTKAEVHPLHEEKIGKLKEGNIVRTNINNYPIWKVKE